MKDGADFISDGYVKGIQTRTIDCYLNNSACLGFNNKEEKQPFCNGTSVFYKVFCQGWYHGTIEIEDQESKKRYTCSIKNEEECEKLAENYARTCHWTEPIAMEEDRAYR